MVSHHEKSYSEEGNLVVHKIVSIGVCKKSLKDNSHYCESEHGLKD